MTAFFRECDSVFIPFRLLCYKTLYLSVKVAEMKQLIALSFFVLFSAWAIGFKYFMDHPNLQQALAFRDFVISLSDHRGLSLEAQQEIIALRPVFQEPVKIQQTFAQAAVLRTPESHPSMTEKSCAAVPSRAVSQGSKAPVYRWTDASGSSSFSDRPPSGMDAKLYTSQIPAQKEYFLLDINLVGQRQLPWLKAQLQSNTTRIFQVLSGLLGEERLRQVELNVRIFEQQADYRRYALSKGSARSAEAGGFYSTRGNEAVTFQYPEDKQTLEVLRHEAVHVIVAGMLGVNTPLWLNEGLAVYFESLQIGGQYGNVSVNEHNLALARRAIANGYPLRLMDLLTLDGESWYDSNQATHYALGWSLVYFLMESSQGRRAMAALLQEKADNYCAQVDQKAWLARSYPGGTASLQRDFYHWVRNTGAKALHRY